MLPADATASLSGSPWSGLGGRLDARNVIQLGTVGRRVLRARHQDSAKVVFGLLRNSPNDSAMRCSVAS